MAQRTSDVSFFHFQKRVAEVLIGWGTGSVVAGLATLFSRDALWRHIGYQAILWGLIDALLGVFGRRQAQQRIARQDDDAIAQAQQFRLIVMINTLLDVGYIASGLAVIRRARGRRDRTGMGIGILIQSLFLLVFDAILTYLSGRWADQVEQV